MFCKNVRCFCLARQSKKRCCGERGQSKLNDVFHWYVFFCECALRPHKFKPAYRSKPLRKVNFRLRCRIRGREFENSGPSHNHCRFTTMLEVVCFRRWRSLPCLCKSSCLCNQRRWSCSRPGPYNRFGLCTRVYPFRHQPWFGERRQDFPLCSLHRHARRWTQLGGRQRPPLQLLLWTV
jgi:hypothetical protein